MEVKKLMADRGEIDLKRAVYQFKVTLKDVHPPVWRRFQVTGSITLYKLHLVLQAVMGWENCHLYQFIIGEDCYGEPDPDFGSGSSNARRVKLVLNP
ncbi:MAG: plasmid pRiA4b ORF-3 family protein [Thermacetogeniaceae bacterium]